MPIVWQKFPSRFQLNVCSRIHTSPIAALGYVLSIVLESTDSHINSLPLTNLTSPKSASFGSPEYVLVANVETHGEV